MNLDPVLLSRLQFAWVIAFHFLLPAFTVGLASFIAILEGLHLASGREIYFRLSIFWIKIFAVSSLGIAISLWPMIVPYKFTLWDAASSEATQAFLLVGTLFLTPVILMYTSRSYWVFRGKVRGDLGCH
jgi:cytochrome bd-type quinol oxidase subunit 2